ncbi:MAG: hypothetical protein Q9162_002783 [Coniocarpon cinnabarinum]
MVAIVLIAAQSATNDTYTYAIAGGGTAGLTLALLLSVDPEVSVIVLEAGNSVANDPRALVPEQEGSLVGTSADWNFTTTPQASLYDNAVIQVPRGKALGGSSVLNYLIWARPSAVELDGWSSVLGLQGWDWESLLPAFEGSENFTDPPADLAETLTVDDTVHGRTGPIRGSMQRSIYSLYTDYVIPTLIGLGVEKPVDRIAGNTTGCGFVPLSIDSESYTRSWSGSVFELVAAQRPNLRVVTGSLVQRVAWNENVPDSGDVTAAGLQYADVSTGNEMTVNADNIVLSAGAVHTPQLLELSGVGDPAILTPLGIDVRVQSPVVGTQTADHLTYAGSFSFNDSSFTGGEYIQDFQDYASPSRFLSAEDYAFASALLDDDSNKPIDTSEATWQMVKYLWQLDDSFIEYGWYYGFVNIYVLHPLSQGTIHAASRDASESPVIDAGYNSANIALANGTVLQWDLWILSKAVQYYATTVPRATPLSSIAARFSLNGTLPFGELEQQVFQGLGSGSHQTGGTMMAAARSDGVVDQNVKVYGTSNVFVADASVVPVSPGEHTMGLVYAIAVKAARLLGGNS